MTKVVLHIPRQPARRCLGERLFQTTEPWECDWMRDDYYRALSVPCGYMWDGASIPRIAWTALGITPSGIADGASLLHDVLYRAAGGKKPTEWRGCKLTNENGNTVLLPREEADALFYDGLVTAGVARHRARMAYLIVRGAVWAFWGRPAPEWGKA